jgi:triple functional domain protein
VTLDKLGEVILQDTFHVWDPKQIIRKGRERHIFLFELYLLFSKEVKDSSGKAKYLYKNKLMVSIRNSMSLRLETAFGILQAEDLLLQVT